MCQECWRASRRKVVAGATTVSVPMLEPREQVAADRQHKRDVAQIAVFKDRYEESLKVIDRLEQQVETLAVLKDGLETFTIEPALPSGEGEATVVLVASDWHIEERVGKEVGGLNVSNLALSDAKARKFFAKGLRLTNLLQQGIKIKTMILALLGDFISNDIHEEFPEVNEVPPMHALVTAQNMIASGIQYLLDNSDLDLVIPCHSGNHARTTRTTRFGTENGHSLEYLMYVYLASHFRHEPRVTFIIPEGMHSYLQVYDTLIRFQHGHAIKYGGGVGGIYIPVNKAIAQWNKAKGRHADLDVFGHFHQLVDGGNFICNGSLIGYNSFALSIKASYDVPKQALFLMDKKRGRTCSWPILVS